MSDRDDTKKKVQMDEEAKKRMMRAEGKKNDGIFDKDGHIPRIQSAADNNEKKKKEAEGEEGE